MKKYYLGLDMGTNSVGWAVTDENYNLLRVKGKDLWGVRMFEEAQTSAERRAYRVSRRRLQREKVRIGLLKDYFHDAIAKEDSSFYLRLENSKYHLEDKEESVRKKDGIFHDAEYTDVDYFKQYPTIFHLRKALMEDDCDHDKRYVRLVFLALLNMFKHRGHFLASGLSGENESSSVEAAYQGFREALNERGNLEFPQAVDYNELQSVLSSRDYSRTKRAELVSECLAIPRSDKQKYEFIRGICGLTVDPKKLFPERAEQFAEEKPIKFSFSDGAYDEKYADIISAVGNENEDLLESMKRLHDAAQLAGILKGYDSLSDSRIGSYEKHKKDLVILKRVIRENGTDKDYNLVFRSDEDGSYSAYVNSFNSGYRNRRNMKGRKPEDLYATIKKLFRNYNNDSEDVQYILDEIGKETFLPKQVVSSNGIIPNQVHAVEMKRILANAEKYLPFLLKRNEKGLTVSEQILQLFTFQVPYYVGPVTENSKKNHGNGWVVRKSAGDVLPWTIEDKIDLKATSEVFIERLVRRCSYIDGEMVLPKNSLMYERYAVLNEINSIKIHGEKISVALKKDIYRDLFESGKRVTRKALFKYLKTVKGVLEDDSDLTGIDITINNGLSSYGKFYSVLGEKMREDSYKEMAEDIVYLCTIYGDSKKFLAELVTERYGDKLSSEQLKRILGFKFKDWGRLSKAFLQLQGCDPETGEIVSLIHMMWEHNLTMMELIYDQRFGFKDALEEKAAKTTKSLKEFRSEDLNEYYFSAPVRRMIWQTLQIIQELEHILGAAPERLFIEMTREGDEKKKRTVSRKNKFSELYANVKDESPAWKREWKELIQKEDESGRIRSKKMYLYLMQQGRCLYTGRTIELRDLFDDNLYDIDHIYPREFTKDDNIDKNLVLVYRPTNSRKSNEYPIDHAIFQSQLPLWRRLRDSGFMSEEKFLRLTCRQPLSPEQKAGFIARQLVETSQGTKGIADLLKQLLPKETTIVYAKASNVSRFRQQNELLKSRSVNDFHHAHDAYLNVVVGNVYYTKFTQNPLQFIKTEYLKNPDQYHYNPNKMFQWDVQRDGKVAWIAKKSGVAGTIETVKATMTRNTPLITRLSFTGHGGILNQTIYGAHKATKELYVPLKSSDPRMRDVTKYGGYTSASTAYFFLVEHEQRNKRVKTFETVPIYRAGSIKTKEDLERYCREDLGLISPRICMSRILIQCLMSINSFNMYLAGQNGSQIVLRNAVPLCMHQDWINYIHRIESAVEKNNYSMLVSVEDNKKLFRELIKKHESNIFARRPNAMKDKLNRHLADFDSLEIADQCKTILEVLKLTAIGTGIANLSTIGESPNSGKIQHAKKIGVEEEVYLINKSITGIYENRVDLQKL